MKFWSYIGLYGSEYWVKKIHFKANIPHAEIKQFKKVKAEFSITKQDAPWGLQTPWTIIDQNDVDAGIKRLLKTYTGLIPIIAEHRNINIYTSLTLIAKYDEDEKPRGFSFSPETIKIITDFGAALDIDAIQVLDELKINHLDRQ